MIAGSTVVLANDQATLVITRGAGHVGPEMPPSSAGAVRSMLRSHAACGGEMDALAAFWAQARGVRPSSHAALIDQIVAAVDARALAAWVTPDHVHLPTVDPAILERESRAQADEQNAPFMPPAMRAPPPPIAPFDVARMSLGARFVAAILRSEPLVGPTMARDLTEILHDHGALAAMAARFATLATLDTVAVGAGRDGSAAAGLLTTALLHGDDRPEALRSARDAAEQCVTFLGLVCDARIEGDLDRAAQSFAALVAVTGPAPLLAALARIAGRVRQSVKKRAGAGA